MVYIEAILSLCNKHHSFRIDADDMKELMDKAIKIIKGMTYRNCIFKIVLFHSNTLNLDHFEKLIESSLPSIKK